MEEGKRTRRVPDGLALVLLAMSLESVDCILRATHVASLCNEFGSSLDESFGLVAADLVLGCTGQRDIDFLDMGPWACTIHVLDLLLEVRRLNHLGQLFSLNLELGNEVDLVWRNAGVASRDERAFAVREGDHRAAKLNHFERRVLGDISRTGYRDTFAFERLFPATSVADHVFNVLLVVSSCFRSPSSESHIDEAVTSSFWPDQASTPRSTLAGQDALPQLCLFLVLTK